MVCTCIHIHRDINGKILGYTVRDLSGNTRNVTPTELKSVIKSGSLEVNNLTLTKDGRLVSKKASNFDNTNLLTGSGIAGHPKAFKVIGRTSFDKWYINFLNKLHARIGGNMRLAEQKEDNGYVYTYLEYKFENIKKVNVGAHHISIVIHLLPTRVANMFIRMFDDNSGELVMSRIGELKYNLYCQENIKTIEKTTREFLKEYNKRLKGC